MIEIKLIAKPIELFKKLEDHAPQHLYIIKIDNYVTSMQSEAVQRVGMEL